MTFTKPPFNFGKEHSGHSDLSPPVPDDVAEKDLEYLIKQLPTDYSQSYYGSSTINKLRAASTPSAEKNA